MHDSFEMVVIISNSLKSEGQKGCKNEQIFFNASLMTL